MRVLGIDPGLLVTGFGCIDAVGGYGTVPTLVEAGVFRLGKGDHPGHETKHETSHETGHDPGHETGHGGSVNSEPAPPAHQRGQPVASISSRLLELDRDLRDLLERVTPNLVAVEGLFAHYKHPSTAIVMGHARGVILLAVRHFGARLVEYKPNEVKKAVAGYGHASKAQIQEAIKDLYRLDQVPTPADMADAIAIATCAAWREQVSTTTR